MTKKSKKVKLLKGEKMMYALLVFLLLAIPIFNVFTSSLLSETNNEVEKITKNIVKYLVKISLDKFTKILYYINNTRITTGKNRRTCVYCKVQ